ncbi:hypothetical protein [Mesorhizobium sp. M0213]|uniref:hypothetical protein n=1 Tax=Mesorhizobium sp. M0213 TaxID=2956917 RepID=UPI00333B8BB0
MQKLWAEHLAMAGTRRAVDPVRERLVYFFESRPRLFDIISRSIEGVAGLILAGVAVWQVAAR